MKKSNILFAMVLTGAANLTMAQEDDQFIWLEEVESSKALEFVEKHNKSCFDRLMNVKEYKQIYDQSLEIYNSPEKIAYPSIYGEYVYNFWQDKEHVRGIWRRATKSSYDAGNPSWEVLLDLDEMSQKDSVRWVYKGSTGLYPDYNRFMVFLSKGGKDAVVMREYDVKTRSFLNDGFSLPEAKGNASYYDENTLIVATDFGDNSLTSSGYPRQVKLWKRGTDIKQARLIYEGQESDVYISGFMVRDHNSSHLLVHRAITFYTNEDFLWYDNRLVKLDLPDDCDINDFIDDQLVISLKSEWKVNGTNFKAGSLVSLDLLSLAKNEKKIALIYEPDDLSSVNGTASTKSRLLVNVLSNVKSELYSYSFSNGRWNRQKVEAPDFGTIYLNSTSDKSDDYYFTYTNFLIPNTLYAANAEKSDIKAVRTMPAYFDANKYKVEQFHSKSPDGALIPYYVVSAKDIRYDGQNPTLLYAYGGFEVPMWPGYNPVMGKAWLDQGGVYVLANIRGGGEFGPKWHQAGLKEKRQTVYNDFHGVAEDLMQRKITSSRNLGIMGGSNGGLLMGVAFTQRPDLYNAVVCAVPLLDMKRFNKLLAGASWMGEYGDPDKPEEWEYISKYSPYHNLKPGQKYPEVFFTTSTRDDRVHPGHARKMVAKMEEMGYPVLYYENTEGGHAGSSTNEQRAKMAALQYSYLLSKLKQKTVTD